MTIPTSNINRNNPPANTPVASVVVRQNFQSAADDIDALWAYIFGLVTGVSSFNGRTGDVSLQSSDVVSALGFNPAQKAGNLNWINPTNTTVPISLVPYAEYAFSVNRINNLVLSSGSLTLSFFINAVPITGLTNIAVTTLAQNITATGANSAGMGDELTMVITNSIGPLNLKFSMLAIV